MENTQTDIQPRIARGWGDLADLRNDEYYINYDGTSATIERVDGGPTLYNYLSTHTFYSKTYEYSTITLLKHGFEILVDNWHDPYPNDVDVKLTLMHMIHNYIFYENFDSRPIDMNVLNIYNKYRECYPEVEIIDPVVLVSKITPIMRNPSIQKSSFKQLKLTTTADVQRYLFCKKQPRNSLCSCGSGKKFKKCCGDPLMFDKLKQPNSSIDWWGDYNE